MNCSYINCHNKISTISTSSPVISCPHCKKAFYCSETCKLADWEGTHKNTCSNCQNSTMSLNSTIKSSLDTSSISNASMNCKPKKTLQDYEVVNIKDKSTPDLGKGSYGSVKLVKEKDDPTNQLYAMKIINKKIIMEYASSEHLKKEVKIQKKLDHPHVIKLFHYFEDTNNVYLILEYAENGSLFFYLRKKKKLSEEEAFIYFFQTCVGIDYLHKKGILHRDLKPENLLLDKSGNIKLCDFGWSTDDAGKRSTFCGTVDYMAPEMIQNKPHDYKIDIWSLGVLLYELIHGMPPFKGKSNDEKFSKILKGDLQFYNVSNEAQDLIRSLLRHDSTQRPNFDIIFNHPWIKMYEKKFKIKVNDYVYKPSKRLSKKKNTDKISQPANSSGEKLKTQTSLPSSMGALLEPSQENVNPNAQLASSPYSKYIPMSKNKDRSPSPGGASIKKNGHFGSTITTVDTKLSQYMMLDKNQYLSKDISPTSKQNEYSEGSNAPINQVHNTANNNASTFYNFNEPKINNAQEVPASGIVSQPNPNHVTAYSSVSIQHVMGNKSPRTQSPAPIANSSININPVYESSYQPNIKINPVNKSREPSPMPILKVSSSLDPIYPVSDGSKIIPSQLKSSTILTTNALNQNPAGDTISTNNLNNQKSERLRQSAILKMENNNIITPRRSKSSMGQKLLREARTPSPSNRRDKNVLITNGITDISGKTIQNNLLVVPGMGHAHGQHNINDSKTQLQIPQISSMQVGKNENIGMNLESKKSNANVSLQDKVINDSAQIGDTKRRLNLHIPSGKNPSKDYNMPSPNLIKMDNTNLSGHHDINELKLQNEKSKSVEPINRKVINNGNIDNANDHPGEKDLSLNHEKGDSVFCTNQLRNPNFKNSDIENNEIVHNNEHQVLQAYSINYRPTNLDKYLQNTESEEIELLNKLEALQNGNIYIAKNKKPGEQNFHTPIKSELSPDYIGAGINLKNKKEGYEHLELDKQVDYSKYLLERFGINVSPFDESNHGEKQLISPHETNNKNQQEKPIVTGLKRNQPHSCSPIRNDHSSENIHNSHATKTINQKNTGSTLNNVLQDKGINISRINEYDQQQSKEDNSKYKLIANNTTLNSKDNFNKKEENSINQVLIEKEASKIYFVNPSSQSTISDLTTKNNLHSPSISNRSTQYGTLQSNIGGLESHKIQVENGHFPIEKNNTCLRKNSVDICIKGGDIPKNDIETGKIRKSSITEHKERNIENLIPQANHRSSEMTGYESKNSLQNLGKVPIEVNQFTNSSKNDEKSNEVSSKQTPKQDFQSSNLGDLKIENLSKQNIVRGNKLDSPQYEKEYTSNLANPRPFSFGENHIKMNNALKTMDIKEKMKYQEAIVEQNEELNYSHEDFESKRKYNGEPKIININNGPENNFSSENNNCRSSRVTRTSMKKKSKESVSNDKTKELEDAALSAKNRNSRINQFGRSSNDAVKKGLDSHDTDDNQHQMPMNNVSNAKNGRVEAKIPIQLEVTNTTHLEYINNQPHYRKVDYKSIIEDNLNGICENSSLIMTQADREKIKEVLITSYPGPEAQIVVKRNGDITIINSKAEDNDLSLKKLGVLTHSQEMTSNKNNSVRYDEQQNFLNGNKGCKNELNSSIDESNNMEFSFDQNKFYKNQNIKPNGLRPNHIRTHEGELQIGHAKWSSASPIKLGLRDPQIEASMKKSQNMPMSQINLSNQNPKNRASFEAERNKMLTHYKANLTQIEDKMFETRNEDSNRKDHVMKKPSRGYSNNSIRNMKHNVPESSSSDDEIEITDRNPKKKSSNENIITLHKNGINNSYGEVEKTEESIEDVMSENSKISRISWRNTVQIIGKNPENLESQSLFTKVKNFFSCMGREPQPKLQQSRQIERPQTNTNKIPKNK